MGDEVVLKMIERARGSTNTLVRIGLLLVHKEMGTDTADIVMAGRVGVVIGMTRHESPEMILWMLLEEIQKE